MHTPTPGTVVGASASASPMRGRILLWAITSSLAGFLFGFDTVVISGAEQKIQALWGLSAGLHGVAMASALYGTVLGSLIGGWPTDRFGRRATLLGIGVLYIVSAVGCGLAPEVWSFLVAFFNQMSGINAILYFAPRIFEMTGLGSKAALLQSVGIGVTNLVFTFVGLWLIDRLGRRTLLYIGSFGYIASLGLASWAFYTRHFDIVPACIFAFIAAHAVGQGAVIWVLISEIFPNRQRAGGQTLGSFTHWIFAALLTTFFPKMVEAFAPGSVFLFFCGMMVLHLVWVKVMVPETKGASLEQIQKRLGIEAE